MTDVALSFYMQPDTGLQLPFRLTIDGRLVATRGASLTVHPNFSREHAAVVYELTANGLAVFVTEQVPSITIEGDGRTTLTWLDVELANTEESELAR